MSSRKSSRPRCPVCGLHLERCLCAELPVLDLPTRFVLVQHNRERHKPTSTGRAAAAALRAPIVFYGAQNEAMETGPLTEPDLDYVVLFPAEDAQVAGPELLQTAPGRRRCVVILDGTWHQCSRMARRAAHVADFSKVSLPPGGPSRWGIRHAPRPEAVCTFEAATRLVEVLHGPDVARPMERFFLELTARMHAQRGSLPPGQDEDDED
ncbi:tRNA-uridine aminocarboxypropyltransferase [Nannocystis punicea]|uniref:tRNA-uridine aminocarboxypropyltransferase n=1 Tax=Nannocystis punicea TaxID=2995304 RepID=A0ABY7H3X9_9BACT|nr:tRNA-uridine aminocarboxypropyltransferase [Nannocystis poenicansa]WAS93988.1 DTW domain-containing protein [Nannocystis poenicansa]